MILYKLPNKLSFRLASNCIPLAACKTKPPLRKLTKKKFANAHFLLSCGHVFQVDLAHPFKQVFCHACTLTDREQRKLIENAQRSGAHIYLLGKEGDKKRKSDIDELLKDFI